MSAVNGVSYSAGRIATRVAVLGKEISRECKGRRLDLVVTLDRGFVFAADLMRHIQAPVVCHFVREDVRDVDHGGQTRREVFFGSRPELSGRDVLVVDAVLESGVTQEFLLRVSEKPGRVRPGWLFCWTKRQTGAWRWSPITLASEMHLNKCGLATAWPRPTVRGAIFDSSPRRRRRPRGEVAMGGRDRGTANFFRRLSGFVRTT